MGRDCRRIPGTGQILSKTISEDRIEICLPAFFAKNGSGIKTLLALTVSGALQGAGIKPRPQTQGLLDSGFDLVEKYYTESLSVVFDFKNGIRRGTTGQGEARCKTIETDLYRLSGISSRFTVSARDEFGFAYASRSSQLTVAGKKWASDLPALQDSSWLVLDIDLLDSSFGSSQRGEMTAELEGCNASKLKLPAVFQDAITLRVVWQIKK